MIRPAGPPPGGPTSVSTSTIRPNRPRRGRADQHVVIEFSASPDEAVRDIAAGSTVLIGGFGGAGHPFALIDALLRQGAADLTVVCNNAGGGDTGLAALLAAGQVRKVVCSFPRQADSYVFDELYRAGKVELELVPQGTLAERIRAGG